MPVECLRSDSRSEGGLVSLGAMLMPMASLNLESAVGRSLCSGVVVGLEGPEMSGVCSVDVDISTLYANSLSMKEGIPVRKKREAREVGEAVVS